jgi:magnesium-transporting ATPase (P-type)
VVPTYWKDLIIGDIVIVQKDERIPADLVLISSEHKDGVAHLETSTLDGEKHLKPRTALHETLNSVQIELLPDQEIKSLKSSKKYVHGIQSIKVELEALVSVQQPQPSIYKFEGFVTLNPKQQDVIHEANKIKPAPQAGSGETRTIPLTIKNFIFKGTKIRNVQWVAGIIVYTGPHTKIQMNGA